MATDSELLFQELVDEDTTDLTPVEQTEHAILSRVRGLEAAFTPDERAALIEVENDKDGLRNTDQRELQALRRRGVMVYETRYGLTDDNGDLILDEDGTPVKPPIGHGKYLKWIEWRNAVYMMTEGREGFDYSVSSCENYSNLYWLDKYHPKIYSQYKHLGAKKMFLIAKWVKDGNAVEDLLDQWRSAKRFLPAGEVAESVQIDPVYDGLIKLIEAGKLNEREAQRIVMDCESGLNPSVIELIKRYGVRDCDALGSLCNAMDSFLRNRRTGKQSYDMITELRDHGGFVTLADGATQSFLGNCSATDIWLGYIAHRAEEETANGGNKSGKLINQTITRDMALRIAERMDDTKARATITADGEGTVYKLALTKPIVDE